MSRRGLTLVECIVVLAIALILLAFLLPAVGRRGVGHAAARMSCMNNLKQLALATMNYNDFHPEGRAAPGHLPTGTVPHATLPPDQRLSWLVTLLPYVEQEQLYRTFDLSAGATANQSAVTLMKVYRCPSAADPAAPHANYVGIAGVGPDAATLPLADPRAGLFGYDRVVRFADVKDGASNTLLVMETSRAVGDWHRGGPTTVRGCDPADLTPVGKGQAFGGLHQEGRSRWNPVFGANAALADGSVRFLTSDTSPAVLAALATVAGGEAVPSDD